MTGTWGDSIERNNDKTRGYYCYRYYANVGVPESAVLRALTLRRTVLLSRCNKLYLLLLFKIPIGADRAPNAVFVSDCRS